MTLNASGPISLGGSTSGQSINLELGQSATAQVSLNDTNVRSLAGVSSGAIVMPTNFYGKSAATLSIPTTTQTVSTMAFKSWSTAYAGFNFEGTLSGKYYAFNSTSTGTVFTELGTWVTPASGAAAYEVMATTSTQSGGQYDSGNFNTWLGLNGGSPTWWIAPQFYDTTATRTITITVRNSSTLATVGSFNVDLSSIWYNFG